MAVLKAPHPTLNPALPAALVPTTRRARPLARALSDPALPTAALVPTTGAAATGEPFIRKTFGGALTPLQPNLVFVIMSFQGDGMDEIYSAIQDECRRLRLLAKRVDENVGADFVIKEIGALIEQAEFIICDLTYERPNVYYELGYRTRLHFDIAPTSSAVLPFN